MADRPIATAPERSIAALSTSVIFTSSPAQRRASKAAPQAAMPPPTIRMSVSSSMICGLPKLGSLIFGSCRISIPSPACGKGAGVRASVLDHRQLFARLREQALIAQVARLRLAGIRVDRANIRRAHGELEALDLPI